MTQTLKTAGIGRFLTLNIGSRQGIGMVEAIAQDADPKAFINLLPFVMEYLGVNKVLISNLDPTFYLIGGVEDADWVLNAINRLEEGWSLQDSVLLSPVPSSLNQRSLWELITPTKA